MKILVTGKHGQVARSLAQRARDANDFELVLAGRPDLDLALPASIHRVIAEAAPDLVINAAAYTAVDDAEVDEAAFRINRDGAGEVAKAAAKCGAGLIQLSTDYVLSGEGQGPFNERVPASPVNAYGRSKLEGENAARTAYPDAVIVRTAWLYSPFGRNFVRTVIDTAAARDELRVVADQFGSPTSALDLADALLVMARAWSGGDRTGLGQIYHIAGSGEASWASLAEAVMEECRALGLPAANVIPIASADWPSPAPRPADSRLDSGKFARDFDFAMPDWRWSLGEVVRQIAAGE